MSCQTCKWEAIMNFHSKLLLGTRSFLVKYSQPVDISISVRGHVGEFTVEAFGLGKGLVEFSGNKLSA